jgi:carbonic anhydrase
MRQALPRWRARAYPNRVRAVDKFTEEHGHRVIVDTRLRRCDEGPMKMLLVALALAAALRCTAAEDGSQVQPRDALTPAVALERLRTGNARFAANRLETRDWAAKVAATASGQFPFAAVLACMDSRAPIEIVFDQGLGDVFGVRVAGNVVNDDELGSLEYAAKVGVKVILVLGHTDCGAVKGAIDGVELGKLTGLLSKIRPAVLAAGSATRRAPSASRPSPRRTSSSR